MYTEIDQMNFDFKMLYETLLAYAEKYDDSNSSEISEFYKDCGRRSLTLKILEMLNDRNFLSYCYDHRYDD